MQVLDHFIRSQAGQSCQWKKIQPRNNIDFEVWNGWFSSYYHIRCWNFQDIQMVSLNQWNRITKIMFFPLASSYHFGDKSARVSPWVLKQDWNSRPEDELTGTVTKRNFRTQWLLLFILSNKESANQLCFFQEQTSGHDRYQEAR